MNKALLWVIAGMAVVVVTLGLKTYQLEKRNELLSVEIKNQELQNILLKKEISTQNASIASANKDLNEYQSKLTALQKSSDERINKLTKQLKNVKTCDDAMDYLKQSLKELKNAE